MSYLAPISEAVILIAGSGSRIRATGSVAAKPLLPIRGRPLICYTFDALVQAGIRTVYGVVGFEAEALIARIRPLVPPSMDFRFVLNRDWRKQNGISTLAVRKELNGPFLLLMGDHLFDQAIVDHLLDRGDHDQLNLAIDRKIDSIFDLDDAMKVQTHGDRVVTIGKDLKEYDAIDTGLFLCSLDTFKYLGLARQDGDCALADGVRLMAADRKVQAIDIGGAFWQDIDTLEMLEHAEKKMSDGLWLASAVK